MNHQTDKYWTAKPCPSDFPERLKKYWHTLQFSLTPIQCGWILYYQDKERERQNHSTRYR